MNRDLKEKKYRMRDVLRDNISGFQGAVQGISEGITGAIHYGLAPYGLTRDGESRQWRWFDESRLEPVMEDSGTSAYPKRMEGWMPQSWDQQYNLWDKVKDKITDLEGTITSINFYGTGCITYETLPAQLTRDGAVADTNNLDQCRVILVARGTVEGPATEEEKPPSPPCDPGSQSSKMIM